MSSEIMRVLAGVHLGGEVTASGFVTVVGGEITSVTTWVLDAVLSEAELLADDNLESLRKLAAHFGTSLHDLRPVRCSLAVPLDGFGRVADLEVPVPE